MTKRVKKVTFSKLLVANRSEIAIRVFRAATELGIRTVAVYAYEDRFALHRFKADESYQIGEGLEPIKAYLSVDEIIRVAKECGADAIHPGYGFLSESPELADACAENGIKFVGPSGDVLRALGDKVSARELAESADVPMVPATGALPDDDAEVMRLATEVVGLPVMIKASWGGGGRGMRMVFDADKLLDEVSSARREALAAFGKDDVFLEKLVIKARHVEVQVLADQTGDVVHLFERDCSVQRRHQKVVEMAPAHWLSEDIRKAMTDAAVRLALKADYENAGTVEFLYDVDSDDFYFIEVNPRVQVEHTVTEEITGIDIVKSQIRIAMGQRFGRDELKDLKQSKIRRNGYAIQCRVTTEDPENGFIPDYGRITAYRGATGFGIRLDGGTAFSGAIVTRYFDSLLEKVTAWASTREEAIARIDRALREFRIRGVKTNLLFLERVIEHDAFQSGELTTRFIDETKELFDFPQRKDRATKVLRFLGNVLVNGNPEVAGRDVPKVMPRALEVPQLETLDGLGTADRLRRDGPEKLAKWVRSQKKLLLTDTTFRDAHQSLLATRMRTYDLVQPMPAYQAAMKDLFSLEVWGGATFDVAYRFLKEDPWARLAQMREATPSILFQMLLRGANAVGYTNYADNVVRDFTLKAADAGVDVFRVFDSLNWVENMRVAIDAVLESGKICQGTICYTGDVTAEDPGKYDLAYYAKMARDLTDAGVHMIAIKDMAGLAKPAAVKQLIKAIRSETDVPIAFHTHDTSGGQVATAVAAAEAGVDSVDAAMDPMSGLTSQPNLGTIVEMLRGEKRDTGLDRQALDRIGRYWEQARQYYAAFESDMKAGTSDVYLHEMPGGQYTNLRQQARAMGLEPRWPDVVQTYADVNQLFGDIVKVTPSSKVVGDLAVFMVSHELTAEDVIDPDKDIAFPDSVISFFKGDLGQPVGGFPADLQKKVLRGDTAKTDRPGKDLPPVDFAALEAELKGKVPLSFDGKDMTAYALYPKVFLDYLGHRRDYGDVSILPTPLFFYGPEAGEEFAVEIAPGKRLIMRYLALGEADEQGMRTVFFELNGQPRTVSVLDASAAPTDGVARKVTGAPGEVGAPMPGVVVSLLVDPGQAVEKGDPLLSLEAMKMESTLFAEEAGTVAEILVQPGKQVDTKDLLLTLEAAG